MKKEILTHFQNHKYILTHQIFLNMYELVEVWSNLAVFNRTSPNIFFKQLDAPGGGPGAGGWGPTRPQDDFLR